MLSPVIDILLIFMTLFLKQETGIADYLHEAVVITNLQVKFLFQQVVPKAVNNCQNMRKNYLLIDLNIVNFSFHSFFILHSYNQSLHNFKIQCDLFNVLIFSAFRQDPNHSTNISNIHIVTQPKNLIQICFYLQ